MEAETSILGGREIFICGRKSYLSPTIDPTIASASPSFQRRQATRRIRFTFSDFCYERLLNYHSLSIATLLSTLIHSQLIDGLPLPWALRADRSLSTR